MDVPHATAVSVCMYYDVVKLSHLHSSLVRARATIMVEANFAFVQFPVPVVPCCATHLIAFTMHGLVGWQVK